MLNRFRRNKKAKAEKVESAEEVYNEKNNPNIEDQLEEIEDDAVELEPLEDESDDEYISDEEWEKMTPQQRAEIEAAFFIIIVDFLLRFHRYCQ